MSGRDLYMMWWQEMCSAGVLPDIWDEISEEEKVAWNAIAGKLVKRPHTGWGN